MRYSVTQKSRELSKTTLFIPRNQFDKLTFDNPGKSLKKNIPKSKESIFNLFIMSV